MLSEHYLLFFASFMVKEKIYFVVELIKSSRSLVTGKIVECNNGSSLPLSDMAVCLTEDRRWSYLANNSSIIWVIKYFFTQLDFFLFRCLSIRIETVLYVFQALNECASCLKAIHEKRVSFCGVYFLCMAHCWPETSLFIWHVDYSSYDIFCNTTVMSCLTLILLYWNGCYSWQFSTTDREL